MASYRVVDMETYYRRDVFRHFTQDCRCSTSITARVDVTELARFSRERGSRFYLDFLYILSRVMNAREDYRMQYLHKTDELVVYDQINPTHYAFDPVRETCTPVYTQYTADYPAFYRRCEEDIARAVQNGVYGLDSAAHPNYFDASYIPWLSYDALHIELPDGNLYFPPIVNWGRYRREGDRLMMPVTVRLNHAVADGYLVANVFRLLDREIARFTGEQGE